MAEADAALIYLQEQIDAANQVEIRQSTYGLVQGWLEEEDSCRNT